MCCKTSICLLGVCLASLSSMGCGKPPVGRLKSPDDHGLITLESTTKELEKYLREFQHLPEVCNERIEKVGKLGTPAAKAALISFTDQDRAAYFESLTDAFAQFDKGVPRELYEVYLGAANKESARLVCAMAIARFSKQDDWALNALIDIVDDACHEVALAAAKGLHGRPGETMRLLNDRIQKATDEKEKKRLDELKDSLQKARTMHQSPSAPKPGGE